MILLVKICNGIYQYAVSIKDDICFLPLNDWDNYVIILVHGRGKLPLIILFNFLLKNLNSFYTS